MCLAQKPFTITYKKSTTLKLISFKLYLFQKYSTLKQRKKYPSSTIHIRRYNEANSYDTERIMNAILHYPVAHWVKEPGGQGFRVTRKHGKNQRKSMSLTLFFFACMETDQPKVFITFVLISQVNIGRVCCRNIKQTSLWFTVLQDSQVARNK